MRLINTVTYEIQEFSGDEIPKYAILSHKWGKEEVTLRDMQTLENECKEIMQFQLPSPMVTDGKKALMKAGFQKIRYTCRQAKQDGLSWAWVDTCCIDKTSSAELSEAINSMYKWYQSSDVCYAFLEDVPSDDDPFSEQSAVPGSRWFTRGWTLQELIAPRNITFFSEGWCPLGKCVKDSGDRQSNAFAEILAGATDIPSECLKGLRRPCTYSVAQRMAWASKRACTRTEDVAYCLLGLFDVNMPLLYGEGNKAFIRLQEEIMKETDDHSLLAWTVPPDSKRYGLPGGILAESPADFSQSFDIFNIHQELGTPSTMTKKGLRMNLALRHIKFPETSHLYWRNKNAATCHAVLNCGWRTRGWNHRRIALLLVPSYLLDDPYCVLWGKAADKYCRFITDEHIWVESDNDCTDVSQYDTIHIHKTWDELFLGKTAVVHNIPLERRSSCWLSYDPLLSVPRIVRSTKPGHPGLDSTLPHRGFRIKTHGVWRYGPLEETIVDPGIYDFPLQSNEWPQLVSLLFGIEENRVLCQLLPEDEVLEDGVRSENEHPKGEVRMVKNTSKRKRDLGGLPWVDATNKIGDLAHAHIQLPHLKISVRLHLEHEGQSGGLPVSAYAKHYLVIFSFEDVPEDPKNISKT